MVDQTPRARMPDIQPAPANALAELWYCTPAWQARRVRSGAYPELFAEMRRLNEQGHDYWIKDPA